ncbi:prepilin-type N-terminal cleavage/methylation domain-containing protein [Variovorax sp. J22G21]|uniref:type IV pilus modification PilV family protein n=1 Tax=Variovorax fucosicus TaxID=3053517 RepID=UPI002578C040|nr:MULTISPECIES: prepilin-type N-terminal cleavage/methylation domain-containing protein [unclassified Variovorax]MDM0039473.1 prepilin-type N-terminal cleavage/methylation domain-containing protein [Variovorax sp. J22R193]MDM0064248.1 prepilin-type N-terminal cleavage/methylation domain-containing protein [Variovorax sp. J22G21]
MKTTIRRQAGSTLIEALVALLIFALGMVGIAGLMASALKYQVGNEARLNVSAAINDLSERIRSNVTGAKGFNAIIGGVTTTGTGYDLAQTYATQVAAAASTYSPDCSAASCTPAQLAAYDQAKWRNLLRATLPGGAGYITGDVTTGFTVSVMWFDKNAVDSDDVALAKKNCTDLVADQNKAGARFCCPANAAVPDGVRCYTTRVLP